MRYALAFLLFMTSAQAECLTPTPPQRDIIADGYYDDPPVYSHIDPVKHAAYETAVKPLETYLRTVAKLASTGQKDCALRWLVAWSEGDAMLGTIEKQQAHYERKWLLSGLALSYAKVRDAASRDQKAAIDTWLQALADGVRSHSDAHKGARNNHYYWEGLAVAATGAVTSNAADIAWGTKVFKDAMADIGDDGTLPLEMKRGTRALHYHLFSAAPLVMLASVLNIPSPKLDKLVVFCRAGMKDPEGVAKQAGVAQMGVLDDDASWLVVYDRRHRPASTAETVTASRAPYVNRLGGDLSQPNPLEHPVAR